MDGQGMAGGAEPSTVVLYTCQEARVQVLKQFFESATGVNESIFYAICIVPPFNDLRKIDIRFHLEYLM